MMATRVTVMITARVTSPDPHTVRWPENHRDPGASTVPAGPVSPAATLQGISELVCRPAPSLRSTQSVSKPGPAYAANFKLNADRHGAACLHSVVPPRCR